MANPFGRGGWTPARLGDQSGKVFAITGANSGIGLWATRILVARGARVLMLCRNPDKAATAAEEVRRETPSAAVELVRCDLSDLGSVRAAAEAVAAATDRLDALVNNAGLMMLPRRELTEDGFEMQLGVNHLAHFALSGWLFERVAAAGGRIVSVSSGAHKPGTMDFEDLMWERGYGAVPAYCRSKLANALFVLEANRRLAGTGSPVRAFLCHPGYSDTNLQTTGPSRLAGALMTLGNKLVAQSAERGAWPTVLCAAEPEARPEAYYGPTGPFEMRGAVGECQLATRATDEALARRLWEESARLTGVSWLEGA